MPTMTAAERRELERLEYNAFLDECPTRQLVATLGDKWVTLVLCALRDGPKRYTEVARHVTPSVPVRVDYELTPLGQSLLVVVAQIKAWAEANMDAVRDARDAYDAASD